MLRDLPEALRLAWWGTSWLRGHVGPDEVRDAVVGRDVGDDAQHLVRPVTGAPEDLLLALGRLRAEGADAVGATFPVDGDLVGLGGPPAFNAKALAAGQAVLVLDAAGGVLTGLVPHRVGGAVTWHVEPTARRQVPALAEADGALREAVLQGADALARLEVARWRPEVADRLMNLRHRPHLGAPPGVPDRCVDLAARGLQALEIAELALEDDGGALSVHEIENRRVAIRPLARAGRAALVAAVSPEVWPPG
jgi:hypothetical protein